MTPEQLQAMAYEFAPQVYSDVSQKLLAAEAQNQGLSAQLVFHRDEEHHRREMEALRIREEVSKVPTAASIDVNLNKTSK